MTLWGVFGLNQFQLRWETREQAEAEAARLSLKHPGKVFTVLCSVVGFKGGVEWQQ